MAIRRTTRKSGTARRKSRNKVGRRRSSVTQPDSATAESQEEAQAAAERFVKVNSALIRSRHRARSGSEEASATPKNRTGRASESSGDQPVIGYRSGSEFIRDQPMDLPTKEVVVAAAKYGLNVTPNLIRIVRFKMRHEGMGTSGGRAKPATSLRPTTPAGTAVPRAANNNRRHPVMEEAPEARGAAETQFRRLVVMLGLARAKILTQEVEKATEALISGG